MENLNDCRQKIIDLSQRRYHYEEKDSFFETSFPQFNLYDQATILTYFQDNYALFLRYINSSTKKEKIEEVFRDAISNFVKKPIDYEDGSLFPILLSYMSLNDVPYDASLYSEIFHKIDDLYQYVDFSHNTLFEEILETYLKNVIYSSSNEEEYLKIVKSSGYHLFEKIVCKYIESMSLDRVIESDFLQLLVEASNQLPTSKIKRVIQDKSGDSVSFKEYQSYIDAMEPVPTNQEEEFIKCIRCFRLQKGILPSDVCYYVNHCYRDYDDLLRLCNIDIIKYYLLKMNVYDATVLYDKDISRYNSRGVTLSDVLALKDVSLNPVMFHMATHLVQYRNFKQNKNYYGNHYDMLKDLVLKDYLSQTIYNRNLNRYLFEIEADYYGEMEYYTILERIGDLSENDLTQKDRLEDNEQFRFSLAHFLNIDGEDYEKGQLFDQIIQEHPEILQKCPIFHIEFYPNGEKKSVIEILKSLDEEAVYRTEEEIASIANCIFGEYYTVENPEQMLPLLKEYVPAHSSILETEKRIIDDILSFLGVRRTEDSSRKK